MQAAAEEEIKKNERKRSKVSAMTLLPDAATEGVSADGQVWLVAYGSGSALYRRAYLAELDGASPQIGDDVAVTGFQGAAWFIGKIIAISVGAGRARAQMMCVFKTI